MKSFVMKEKRAGRLRVLISAYACEPNRGSEPEVGWQTSLVMASFCDVLVVTRENNRPVIEKELMLLGGDVPRFIYYDLPWIFRVLKRGFVGMALYYFLWQIAVRIHLRSVIRSVDVIHHVTFNGIQLPGFWVGTDAPVVLGPLGGGMKCPENLVSIIGRNAWRERFRSFSIALLPRFPLWKWLVADASVVLAANDETAHLLSSCRSGAVKVMLETAVRSGVVAKCKSPKLPDARLKILWIGNLVARKAPILAIRAVVRAVERGAMVELMIAGAGPELARLQEEVVRLGACGYISFVGRVPKSQVARMYDEVSALLFTSIRDTSGNVVLEAMSRCVPVIAIHHQGIRVICREESAFLVEPGTVDELVDGLADKVVLVDRNRKLAERIGELGAARVAECFTWEAHCNQIFRIYLGVIDQDQADRR